MDQRCFTPPGNSPYRQPTARQCDSATVRRRDNATASNGNTQGCHHHRNLMFPPYSLLIPSLFPPCSLLVPSLFPPCSLLVHCNVSNVKSIGRKAGNSLCCCCFFQPLEWLRGAVLPSDCRRQGCCNPSLAEKFPRCGLVWNLLVVSVVMLLFSHFLLLSSPP